MLLPCIVVTTQSVVLPKTNKFHFKVCRKSGWIRSILLQDCKTCPVRKTGVHASLLTGQMLQTLTTKLIKCAVNPKRCCKWIYRGDGTTKDGWIKSKLMSTSIFFAQLCLYKNSILLEKSINLIFAGSTGIKATSTGFNYWETSKPTGTHVSKISTGHKLVTQSVPWKRGRPYSHNQSLTNPTVFVRVVASKYGQMHVLDCRTTSSLGSIVPS